MADGWETRLLKGFCQLLADAGVGTYSETVPYSTDQVAITRSSIPDTPDRCVTLACYHTGRPAVGVADAVVLIQARVRGTTDPDSRTDLTSAVTEALEGLARVTVGAGIRVKSVAYRSSTLMGADDKGRWEASINFEATVMRPTILNGE
jgi:hypothetical protein